MADAKTDSSSTPLSDDPANPTKGLSAKPNAASHPAGAEPALDTLFLHVFYGAGGQDAPSPRAVGSFFDRRRPHGLDCPVDDSGWGGVRSQGPHRSPEDVHSRRVLRSGAGTILLSGTLWPIASFGSPGVHSL